ncbi:hypothetical protein ASD38_14345 [Caulobacter sp. Root487D2Y]|jgi:hypothetical protein|uniref:hypothetical protein n=1 Tax=Caulobacter sp. Root487D2Y TaxID=1736547 RepID=UPI0006F75C3C|nr:hypothetical protein [Caulobacter sp. Root487D2Y]KQY28822.1 hypothetical protein ASD38_14345 [Caulobacter sp. Root487D2Y]
MLARTAATVATALFAFAAPAAAQEQTPENAQKFIAQIAGLGQINYTDRSGSQTFTQGSYQDNSGSQTVVRYYDKAVAPIWDVTSPSRCETQFKRKLVWSRGGEIVTSNENGYMNWKRVMSVTVSGANIVVADATQWSDYFHRFSLPTEDMAKRVGYAMEFLRVSCDATQGTGF